MKSIGLSLLRTSERSRIMAYIKSKQTRNARRRQLLEVVDAENRVVGLMPRFQIHDQQLMHRSVMVCLYNSQKKLFIRKRDLSKKMYPGCWDVSAAGHVQAAETPKETAIRKLKEGLGVTVSRVSLQKVLPAEARTEYEFVFLYCAGITAQVPQPDQREVMHSLFVDQDELACMVHSCADWLSAGLLYFWRRGLLFQPA